MRVLVDSALAAQEDPALEVLVFSRVGEGLLYEQERLVRTSPVLWGGSIGFPKGAKDFRYYFIVRDFSGADVFLGSAVFPYQATIERGKPWYRKWWLWTAGAAVVGVVVRLLAADHGEAAPAGHLGMIH